MMRFNSKKIKERSNIALNSKSTWSNGELQHIFTCNLISHIDPTNTPYRSNQYPIAEISEISSYHFIVLTRLPCYVGCSSRIWFRDQIITHIPLNEKKIYNISNQLVLSNIVKRSAKVVLTAPTTSLC